MCELTDSARIHGCERLKHPMPDHSPFSLSRKDLLGSVYLCCETVVSPPYSLLPLWFGKEDLIQASGEPKPGNREYSTLELTS